ncbi:MAG: molybdopterin cofactor-binding domain-containing protein, partial [Myxococcota bacterium]
TPSLVAGSAFEGMMEENGLDPTTVEGARETAYALPNYKVSVHQMETKVPVLWWRSVGHTHTGYVLETMMDELLDKAGRDPVDGRLALMGESPRDAGALRRVAELADWGRRPAEGHAYGVAVHKSFGTYVAQIADVSLEDGRPRVHKVWCAVDCGVAVNPDIIRAQMEGGIGFATGAVLFDAIDLGEGGRPLQANWDTYRMIRMNEMPEVEVAIIDSDESPTGVGEPGVPPTGPAIANAMRRLTGQVPRQLPIVTPVEV